MKHVLFISNLPSSDWGGSEELWSMTALSMCKKGFRVSVDVISSPENMRLVEIANAGGQIHQRSPLTHRIKQFAEIILRDKAYSELPKLKRVALERALNSSCYRQLDKLRPDLVVIAQTDNYNGWDWMAACVNRGIAFVTIAQSASENIWPTLSISKFIGKHYNSAKKQFFVSRRNLELTRMQVLASLENAEIVRNPFSSTYDISSLSPMPDVSTLRLACIGRLHIPSKGQDLICQLMAMEKWRQRPIEVCFYGKGEHGPSIQTMIDEMGLTNLRLCGQVTDIDSVWHNCHALLLPSRYEGLPLVVVEAMMCGRVPIVTDVAGNAEVIEHEHTGYLACAPTLSELDKVMELAWSQRTQWSTIGMRAAKRIRELVPEDPAAVLASKIEELIPESR